MGNAADSGEGEEDVTSAKAVVGCEDAWGVRWGLEMVMGMGMMLVRLLSVY